MIKDVMIIEDEVLIAHSLSMDFEDNGLNVLGLASNYEEALSMLKVHSPDLIFADINLKSDQDGIDVAIWVNKNFPDIKIIFMTGYGYDSIMDRIEKVKYLSIVEKPVEAAEIIKLI